VLGKDYRDQDCLVARALEVVGERWTLLVVRDAFWGVRRFGEFREHLDIPRAVLSDRLKGLVENGVMTRHPDPDRPRREIYELTEAGRDLWPIVYGLSAWASEHVDEAGGLRVFTHVACGQALDPAGACKCSPRPPVDEIVISLRPGVRPGRKDRVSLALAHPHRLLTPLELDDPVPAAEPAATS
jgi:DNA-binding HxlR family transcriptional regulator